MELGWKDQYKTVRGWSGKRYKVRMTEAEIKAKNALQLTLCIVIGTPAWILIMALAAGLI